MQELKELLRAVLDGILSAPHQVHISTSLAPSGTLVFSVLVPPSEDGGTPEFARLVGREGQTIHAIRRIMTVGAAKHGLRRVIVEVVDGGCTPQRRSA